MVEYIIYKEEKLFHFADVVCQKTNLFVMVHTTDILNMKR